jgi:Spy/CpxP family protein refolding chaperone
MKALNKFSIFTIVIAMCMFVTIQAQPQTQSQTNVPPKRHKEFVKKGLWEQLNLTPEQKAKIAELSSTNQKAVIDLKADLEKLLVDKKDLIRKGDFDRKQITDLEKQIINIKDKLHMASFNHKMDIIELLTPEQKEKVKNMKFWMDKSHERQGHPGMQQKDFRKSK